MINKNEKGQDLKKKKRKEEKKHQKKPIQLTGGGNLEDTARRKSRELWRNSSKEQRLACDTASWSKRSAENGGKFTQGNFAEKI